MTQLSANVDAKAANAAKAAANATAAPPQPPPFGVCTAKLIAAAQNTRDPYIDQRFNAQNVQVSASRFVKSANACPFSHFGRDTWLTHVAILKAATPIIPVSRPSFSRVPPG